MNCLMLKKQSLKVKEVRNKSINYKRDSVVDYFLKIYKQTGFFTTALLKSTLGFSSKCKHTPTCSEYTAAMVKKHGIISGLFNGLVRIINCR